VLLADGMTSKVWGFEENLSTTKTQRVVVSYDDLEYRTLRRIWTSIWSVLHTGVGVLFRESIGL
jgi:hypothetical protein